jgi:indole-3-glycerol phosphate synthase
MSKQTFIAEIKTQSPFGFKSKHSFGDLMDVAIENGEWISVHTNALWGGDYNAISFVRRNTNKPILAKGIHATDDDVLKAIDHGADYVLVVDRHFGGNTHVGKQVIYERHDPNFAFQDSRGYSQLDFSVNRTNGNFPNENIPLKYLVNARNLSTGLVKPNYTSEMFNYLKAGVWVCQGSGIKSLADVHPDAHAFVVGEHLIDFCFDL